LADKNIAGVLQIQFFSDLHGWILPPEKKDDFAGMDKISHKIEQNSKSLREYHPDIPQEKIIDIVVLSGDIFSPNSYYCSLDNGNLLMKCLRKIGIDGFCLGNHEFYLRGFPVVLLKSGLCKKAFITRNICFPGIVTLLEDSFIISINGIKIHFVGLITDNEALLNGDLAKDPIHSAREYIRINDETPGTYIIPVTHVGMAKDKQIMGISDKIMLIIGGHDHREPGVYKYDEERFICRTKINGYGIGSVIIEFYEDNKFKIFKPQTDPFAKEAKSDPDMKNLIDSSKLIEKVIDLRNRRNRCIFDIPLSKDIIRKDTDMGLSMAALFNRYAREELSINSDAVLLYYKSIRKGLKKGTINGLDIMGILPFNSEIMCYILKGKDLREIIELMIRATYGVEAGIEAGYLCISGMKIFISKTGKQHTVRKMEIDGNPLDDDREYRILSTDYFFNKGKGKYNGIIKDRAYNINNSEKTEQDALLWGLVERKIEKKTVETNGVVHIEEITK